MIEYIDIKVDEYLKPCPHCGFFKPQGRKYLSDSFSPKYAVLCDYREGGCGAESGHYHTLFEAVSNWNQRTVVSENTTLELTKERVRADLIDLVTYELIPLMRCEHSNRINYLDVAKNIESYDESYCDTTKEIDLTSEINSIVNKVMDKLFSNIEAED